MSENADKVIFDGSNLHFTKEGVSVRENPKSLDEALSKAQGGRTYKSLNEALNDFQKNVEGVNGN